MTIAFDVAARRRNLSAIGNPLIWDMVVPLSDLVGNGFGLLARYYAAGHGYVSLTLAGDECDLGEAMHRIAGAQARIAANAEHLVLVERVDDIHAARRDGKMAVGLHLEGTGCLERDVNLVETMYALGIRHCILAFNQNNAAGGGCADLGNVGLSRLGQRYVDAMAKVGMLLDCSHSSERTAFEAMERMGAPVVFTHSNAQAVQPQYRNISDGVAKACAATGGLIGVSGASVYVGDAPSLAEGVFRHIDHFVQLLGPDHVGLGTDYIVDTDAVLAYFAAYPEQWPTGQGITYDRVSYLPPEEIPLVIRQMAEAGYGEEAISGILGGNWLRVASAVWKD